MKKLLSKLLLSYAAFSALPQTVDAIPPDFNIDLSAGYRQDRFRWATKDAEVVDDPTEKVKWKDLQLFEVNGIMNYTSCTGWYFRVNGNYGRIYSGRVVDKDYLEIDGADVLVEKNHGNGGRGEVFDAAGGAGFAFISNGGRLIVAPLIGYIHSEQHLRAFDIHNEFLSDLDPIGPVSGAHNTYNTRWYGGFAAYDLLLNWNCNLKFYGTIQGEMGNYRAKANWNLREDIIGDIYHKSNFIGFYGIGGFIYNIYCNNYIGVSGSYRNLWTRSGKQRMHRRVNILNVFGTAIGSEEREFKQKFSARWRTWSVMGTWAVHY